MQNLRSTLEVENVPLVDCVPLHLPRSGELRTHKLKSHLLRTQSSSDTQLSLLPLKRGEGQYIAMHATLTARDFFLANFYLPGPFTFIFPKHLLSFSVLALANAGSCVGPQKKIGHLARRNRWFMQVTVLNAHGMWIAPKHELLCIVIVSLGKKKKKKNVVIS